MLPGMTSEAVPLDRRQRRRLETIEEVLDIAAEIMAEPGAAGPRVGERALATAGELMAEQGAGGLGVGEIARRMGIRPPSLYVYFPSKNALYDALFARGAELLVETMQEHAAQADESASLADQLLAAARGFIEWC